jgi:DNA-binding transcriptional regulator GbsR (MarR family)
MLYTARMTSGDVDEAVNRFVERFSALLTDSGMPRMAARVYARILAEDSGQLTAAEIAERLDVSPAAVSGAVRYLTRVGMLVRTREPGARRDVYRVHDDALGEMYEQQATMLRRWMDAAEEGAAAIGMDRPAGRRLAETREFFAFLHAELPVLIRRWRARKASVGAAASARHRGAA